MSFLPGEGTEGHQGPAQARSDLHPIAVLVPAPFLLMNDVAPDGALDGTCMWPNEIRPRRSEQLRPSAPSTAAKILASRPRPRNGV